MSTHFCFYCVFIFSYKYNFDCKLPNGDWTVSLPSQTHAYYATKEKPSAVLPSFPNVNTMELPPSLSRDKLHTFMVMYRAHCQRILDSVVRATFSEVSQCVGVYLT